MVTDCLRSCNERMMWICISQYPVVSRMEKTANFVVIIDCNGEHISVYFVLLAGRS